MLKLDCKAAELPSQGLAKGIMPKLGVNGDIVDKESYIYIDIYVDSSQSAPLCETVLKVELFVLKLLCVDHLNFVFCII